MSTWLECVPAYGRDYTRKADVIRDWKANKDFAIVSLHSGGTYINRADAAKDPSIRIIIRYDQQRKVTTV